VVLFVFVCFGCAAADAQQDSAHTDVKSQVAKTSPKITNPIPVKTPDPDYPAELRKEGIQGTVGMDIVVGEDGKVKDVVVKKSADLRLNAQAVKTVKKWKFRPATKDGTPFAKQIYVETNFRVY
jgi:protein TonB